MNKTIPYNLMNKQSKYMDVPFANPVDWFNENYDFISIINYANKVHHKNGQEDPYKIVSSTQILKVIETKSVNGAPYKGKFTHEFNPQTKLVKVLSDKMDDFAGKKEVSLFEFATIIAFNKEYETLFNFVLYEVLNKEMPYIRVGTDYYKKNIKQNRYGVNEVELKPWNKVTLIDDYGKGITKKITKFDDFTIVPDNINYKPIIGTFYNLYNEFPHKAVENNVLDNIPVINGLMEHIFGEQVELGYKYLKVLYENPKQALPVLTLVSKERQTGKTTFLNMLQIIFGSNYVLISPNDLTNDFNGSYATKNIIGIDETTMEKSQAIEKLKAIATQKTIMVNQKHVSQYAIPFFGKVVICSNKEKDFMRIDEEEIRFWVRKVPAIKKVNTMIEKQIKEEVPNLLGYLLQLPEINYDKLKSRMVFSKEEINTQYLQSVVKESFSGLRKQLTILFNEYFLNNNQKAVQLTVSDIKEKWYATNSNVSIDYIRKVVKEEMQILPEKKSIRYEPWECVTSDKPKIKIGRVFNFMREYFIDEENEPINDFDELPFGEMLDNCPFD